MILNFEDEDIFKTSIDKNHDKSNNIIRIIVVIFISSTIVTEILLFSAILLYPDFSWIYNTFSEFGLQKESFIPSVLALIITFLGNYPLLIYFLKRTFNYNKFLFLGTIFLIFTNTMIGFEGIIPIFFFDLHLIGAQILLISFVIALGLYIVGFQKEDNRSISILCVIKIIIMIILWAVFFYFDPKIGYAIPEFISSVLFYILLIILIFKLLQH
ncbi:MAG: hypothetical protein GF329_12235 [Candidatus Lokiarchaeota archaeon]|nr:hypothetical protein [Candidatus Lokiarchaeota archaeon]